MKTVLFKPADLNKNCWNQREISLLGTRKVMQDLIPKHLPKDLEQLLKYLKTAQEIIESDCSENEDGANVLVRLALADIIGGYLQSVAIPVARESYYSGELNYDTISQLQDMLDGMKEKLGTNGDSWSRQIDARKFSKKVSALDFTGRQTCACNALFLNYDCPEGKSKIPLPYLDDDERPAAIALPLTFRNLYPLKHPSSTHVLLRYYTLSVNCLKNSTHEDLMTFNENLHSWITDIVYPRLYDEDEWYAGFAGVLRILETMRRKGLTSPVYPVVADRLNLTTLESSLSKREFCNDENHSFEYYLLLLIIFILLLCCFCFCCVYAKAKDRKNHETDMKEFDSADALLSFYCGLREAKTQNDGRYQGLDDEQNNVYLKPALKKDPANENGSLKNEENPIWNLQMQYTSDEDGENKEWRQFGQKLQMAPADKCEFVGWPCSTTQLPNGGEKAMQSDEDERKTNVVPSRNVTRKPFTMSFKENQQYPVHKRKIVNSEAEASEETETSVEDS